MASKVALCTGGSGDTQHRVEQHGRKCHLIRGDVGDEGFCRKAVREGIEAIGGVNVLCNLAAEQHPREEIDELTAEQVEKTFRTNIFGYIYMAKHAREHLDAHDSIINTASVTAYKGHPTLLDYASTKGAIVAFTRSLAENLKEKKIRVNAVAPGPIWTPLIAATFDEEKIAKFGTNVPLGRPGEPCEVAPCYVFRASDDGSYMTGQTLHPNGGGHF